MNSKWIPTEDNRYFVIDILNTDFAEEYVLLTKTKMKLEWSRSYNDLYKFLKVDYKLFEEMVDELAERLWLTGGKSITTLKISRWNWLFGAT